MSSVVAEVASRMTSPPTSLKPKGSDENRILIVCDDDFNWERLNTVLRETGFTSDRVRSITAGCESAKSGRFQVVITVPEFIDGSWKRLADIASHYDLGFVILFLANSSDLKQWAEALEDGAFDVLDVAHELPKVAEVTKRALWAAYLKGGGPNPEAAISPKAA